MTKVNFADFYAYTQQKAEQEREERRAKALEKIERMNERRERKNKDISELFKKISIGAED